MNRFQALLTIPVLALCSCKMPESIIDSGDYDPYFKVEDPEEQDKLEDIKNIVPPDAPFLYQLPELYYYDSIPVKGTATPGTDILISSSEKGVVAGRVGSDGTFCVDLPLALDKEQEIKARVHNGVFSEYTSTKLAQKSFNIQPEEPSKDDNDNQPVDLFTLENVAVGTHVYSEDYKDFRNGLLENLTDNNENTSVELKDGAFGGAAIVWLDLAEVNQEPVTPTTHKIYIAEIVLTPEDKSPDGYPDEIKIYTSTAHEVDSPAKDAWDVGNVSALQATYHPYNNNVVKIVLYKNPEARWVGIEFNFTNNAINRWASVKEIRLYEQKAIEAEQPEDPEESPVEGLITPTCANGIII